MKPLSFVGRAFHRSWCGIASVQEYCKIPQRPGTATAPHSLSSDLLWGFPIQHTPALGMRKWNYTRLRDAHTVNGPICWLWQPDDAWCWGDSERSFLLPGFGCLEACFPWNVLSPGSGSERHCQSVEVWASPGFMWCWVWLMRVLITE